MRFLYLHISKWKTLKGKGESCSFARPFHSSARPSVYMLVPSTCRTEVNQNWKEGFLGPDDSAILVNCNNAPPLVISTTGSVAPMLPVSNSAIAFLFFAYPVTYTTEVWSPRTKKDILGVEQVPKFYTFERSHLQLTSLRLSLRHRYLILSNFVALLTYEYHLQDWKGLTAIKGPDLSPFLVVHIKPFNWDLELRSNSLYVIKLLTLEIAFFILLPAPLNIYSFGRRLLTLGKTNVFPSLPSVSPVSDILFQWVCSIVQVLLHVPFYFYFPFFRFFFHYVFLWINSSYWAAIRTGGFANYILSPEPARK